MTVLKLGMPVSRVFVCYTLLFLCNRLADDWHLPSVDYIHRPPRRLSYHAWLPVQFRHRAPLLLSTTDSQRWRQSTRCRVCTRSVETTRLSLVSRLDWRTG